MGNLDNGGYAFPMEATDATAWRDCNQGMTLRDYFAAKAMQAIISNPSMGNVNVAQMAYGIADTMLSERAAISKALGEE